MKELQLSNEEKADLELHHRYEGNGRVRDRIKAVLLKSEGWSNKAIAQALRIHEETVREHLKDWQIAKKLTPENGGSTSKLEAHQSQSLELHLEKETYVRVVDICTYVEKTFGVTYTVSGMTKWLKQHDFRYKQPKRVPAKTKPSEQEAFKVAYSELKASCSADEPILFMDSAHPTMVTKVVCGWIKKGQAKLIAQTASRTRVNVTGAIELATMKVVSCCPDKVNETTTVSFLEQVKKAYPMASNIHIILDNSRYHRSQLVQEKAAKYQMTLHFLPPYSPNLNPIERLWKIMNEHVRNNVFFSTANDFRLAIVDFFTSKITTINHILKARINDNFQTIQPVPSG